MKNTKYDIEDIFVEDENINLLELANDLKESMINNNVKDYDNVNKLFSVSLDIKQKTSMLSIFISVVNKDRKYVLEIENRFTLSPIIKEKTFKVYKMTANRIAVDFSFSKENSINKVDAIHFWTILINLANSFVDKEIIPDQEFESLINVIETNVEQNFRK